MRPKTASCLLRKFSLVFYDVWGRLPKIPPAFLIREKMRLLCVLPARLPKFLDRESGGLLWGHMGCKMRRKNDCIFLLPLLMVSCGAVCFLLELPSRILACESGGLPRVLPRFFPDSLTCESGGIPRVPSM